MKKILSVLLCLILVFSLAACGDGGENEKETVYEITWAGTLAEDHLFNQTLKAHLPELEEASGGRLTVKLYPNNQLGDSRSNLEQMQVNGSIQMGEMSGAVLAIFTDDYNMLSLPFLFKNLDQMLGFMHTDYVKELDEKLSTEVGVRPLAWVYNGTRALTNSKRTVTSPADMKGLKIRVMESDVYLKMFESMGAVPMAMSFAEVFTGLQQGTIDGQDNAITNVISQKFDEVQPYYTDLGHVIDAAPILISEEYWKSIPADLQVVLQDWLDSWVTDYNYEVLNNEKAAEDSISDHTEITRLTDEQRLAFREVCAPVYDWFAETYTDVDLDEVQEIINGL